MESLNKNALLLFPDKTLENVRKKCNVQGREDMDRAIDILDYWIKQQAHFNKKDFSRSYLERLIIMSKGSIERTKTRLDSLCTARTHLPYFFGLQTIAAPRLDLVEDALLPKQTKDYCRVYLLRNMRKGIVDIIQYQNFYQRIVYFLEYFCKHDYNAGIILIADYRELDIIPFLKSTDIVLLQKAAAILFKSYGLSVKSIHIISPSKLISLVVSLFKQVVSDKIGSRINVHETFDEVYDVVDKDIFPKDYGGEELPLMDLHKSWLQEFRTNDFIDHLKDTYEAKIIEEFRPSDKASDEYSSLHGTFRSLTVD